MLTTVGVSLGALGIGMAAAVHLARRVLTPATRYDEPVRIQAIEPHPAHGSDEPREVVWLSGDDNDLPGRYSLIFDQGAGHARIGPVRERRGLLVSREVLSVERGKLRVGAQGRVTGWWYTDPAQTGFSAREVRVPLEGGHARAWLVTPDPDQLRPGRWAVHVHGRGALPEETLRGVVPLARAGLTNLVISYRNDPNAPSGLRARYGLGLAESRDVDSAIAWAREHGADRVTLVGWSMGGTACLRSAARGPLRQMVDALVLDSPAVDWPSLLKYQAALAGAPGWVAAIAQRILRWGVVRGAVPGRRGTAVDELCPERIAAELRHPVLIHAGPDDSYVPWNGARRLAELRPDSVTLRQAAGEHVKLWNVDPDGWEAATEAFVRALPDPGLNYTGR